VPSTADAAARIDGAEPDVRGGIVRLAHT
jgi:hypothetical protein